MTTSRSESAVRRYNEQTGIEFLRRRDNGTSPPIVLLHGIGSNADSYSPLMGVLPVSFDAIAWNMPGYGRSKRLKSEAPTPYDYAAALLDFLDALALPQVALVGHSLGALFSGSFAARYPDRVSTIALLSPALGYRVQPGSPLPATLQSRLDEVSALGPEEFAASRAPRLVSDPAARPDVVAAVEKAMGSIDPLSYRQAVSALGAGDLIGAMKTVTVPTLVAVGDRDRVTPPDQVRPAYDCLGNPAGYHLVANAGHAMPQEQPLAVAGLLAQLIKAN